MVGPTHVQLLPLALCYLAVAALAMDITLIPQGLPVMREGVLDPSFNPNTTAANLYREDEIYGVATFSVTADTAEFYGPPTLTCAGCETFATPEIDRTPNTAGADGNIAGIQGGVLDEEQDLTAEVMVYYHCLRQTDKPVTLTLTLPLMKLAEDTTPLAEREGQDPDAWDAGGQHMVPSGELKFTWQKSCGKAGTVHTGVELYFEEKPVVVHGLTDSKWSVKEPSAVLGADFHEISFSLSCSEGSFVYEKPQVDAGATVSVKAIGSASKPGSVQALGVADDTRVLDLLFESCTAPAIVHVSWNIAPHAPIAFSFLKECPPEGEKPKGKPKSLNVMVDTPDGRLMAVTKGVAQDMFLNGGVRLGTAAEVATLWLSTEGTEEITLSNVQVFQAPSYIVVPEISTTKSVVIGSTPVSIGVKLTCQKRGQTDITMTLIVDGYSSIDLLMKKECPSTASIHRKQQDEWNSSFLFLAIMLGFAGGIAFYYFRDIKDRKPTLPIRQPRNID